MDDPGTAPTWRTPLSFPLRVLLQLTGAALFAIGLATRVPAGSVPREIISSNGTLPGFLLGGAVFVGMLIVEAFARGAVVFHAAAMIKTAAMGGLCFATGATMLAYVNTNRA